MITLKSLENLWVHRQQWDLFEQFLGGREGVEPTPEVIREAALFGLDVVGARDAGLLQLPDGPIDFKMGCRVWYLDGEVSREDGPAIDWGQGAQHWFLHGKRHRVDGPAILRANGHQEWWLHDLRHREDGPAVVRSDGTKEWWLHGERIRVERADGCTEWYQDRKCVRVEWAVRPA